VLISREGDEYGIEDSAAPIRNEAGDLLGVVLVFHDVTEQRRLSGEMSYRASHDALTGLINRAEFEARLRRTLNKAHEERSQHALMYIDLDQFKLVNDACGHSVGDQLLQQVAKLMGETVRARDTLARLGGDEFAVILEHCTTDQAQRVAQQICDRMDDFRFVHDGRRFRIGTSIGLVPVDTRWANTAAVMQAADTSCYAAKEAGRNRVHAWFDTDQAMRARHGEMQWATRLEQAIDDNRFVLYAQKIHPLRAQTSGLHAEVLLRLLDTDGSLIPPGAFLPAAERFHLSSRIDRWVLQHALVRLRAVADLKAVELLCINLSGQSIGDRAFHRHAVELLTLAGPAVCQRVCFEITETAAITNMADATHFIEQVRALGVRMALDDFGAGASSFGYLKTLPVDLLKIDGQFIKDLIDDPLDDAAVRCFVDVARVVGLKTVAEFVDRPEILQRVREHGIDYAQGFLLHRPEPFDQVLGSLAVRAEVPV
jgi:diguanylate cyclase